MMISCDFSSEKSELVTRLAEGALGIREDLGGREREHRDRLNVLAVKGTAAHLVLPSSVPLGGTWWSTPGQGV